MQKLLPVLCSIAELAEDVLDFQRDSAYDTVDILCSETLHSPFPQIDIIGAMLIVWRVRRKIIRSVLCSIVCNNCAQCDAHTHTNRHNSSLDLVLSHWAHFTVLTCRFIFVCIIVYCVHV